MTWSQRIAAALASLATAFVMIVLTSLHYEGVPLLRSIPYVGRIAQGEIARRVEAAKSGYVLESETIALHAKLEEMERQRNAGAQALEEYRRRADADARLEGDRKARTERAISDDAAIDDDAPVVTPGDIEWLRIHQ